MKILFLKRLSIILFFLLSVSCLLNANELKIYQVDMGIQVGDCYLIIAPDGTTTLLDTGLGIHQGKNYAENILFPFLKKHDVKKIEQVIISHLHDDHFGALSLLLQNPDFTVSRIYWSYIEEEKLKKAKYGPEAERMIVFMREIQKTAAEKKVPLLNLETGTQIEFGGKVIGKTLIAARPDLDVNNYFNNNSAVIWLEYGNFTMLFMGDAGFDQEGELLRSIPNLNVKVLKTGHHGGAGSNAPEFLRAVAPDCAISSMPKWLSEDSRGMEVQKRLDKQKTPHYRSWEYPNLAIFSDGKTYRIILNKTEIR